MFFVLSKQDKVFSTYHYNAYYVFIVVIDPYNDLSVYFAA